MELETRTSAFPTRNGLPKHEKQPVKKFVKQHNRISHFLLQHLVFVIRKKPEKEFHLRDRDEPGLVPAV